MARDPPDPDVRGLVDELVDGNAEFARLGERHDVAASPARTKTLGHPAVGPITLDCERLTLDDRDQHLVLSTAPAGSRDAEALTLLGVLGAGSAQDVCPSASSTSSRRATADTAVGHPE